MAHRHISTCPQLRDPELSCTCKTEAPRYLRLAKYSLLTIFIDLCGWWFGSIALLANMFHDLVDLSENLLSAWIARRARSSMNELRLRRVGGGISITLIFATSLLMLHEAREHLHSAYSIDLRVAIPLAIIGLFITVRQLIIHEGAPDEHRNVTHVMQWLHLVLDILGVTAALIGLILSYFGFAQSDAYAALVIVGLIWIRVAQVAYGLITGKEIGHDHHKHSEGENPH